MLHRKNRNLGLHLMMAPAIVLLVIYSYGPMVGLLMAFQDYHPLEGFWKSPFVGLDNFRYVFEMQDFQKALRNTFVIAISKIVTQQLFCIVIALLLNEVRKAFVKRFVQTLIYLPHFLSWVILGGIMIQMLSPSQGIVNDLLRGFGLEPIFFLGDNHWFRKLIVASNLWKEFGFGTIVYLAAITSVDPSLYESAAIDGAGRWRQTIHVTLPTLTPVIVLLATLSLGQVLSAGFDQIFILYSPSTYETGDIIDTLVYRVGLVNSQFSVGTAVGLFKSLVSFVLICCSYILAYRYANYRIF